MARLLRLPRPEACDVETLTAVDVHVTPAVWDELDRINRAVDRAIVSITGWDRRGTMPDQWDYPVGGEGDCKIHALETRRRLLDAGGPERAARPRRRGDVTRPRGRRCSRS